MPFSPVCVLPDASGVLLWETGFSLFLDNLDNLGVWTDPVVL